MHYKKNCNLLQTAGSSSVPSAQSRSPSQCHILGMHLPLLHLNSVSLHSWVSEMFVWLRATAATEGMFAHASSSRMHVHRETSEGRVELLPPSCMVARGERAPVCSCVQTAPRKVARCTTRTVPTAHSRKTRRFNQRSINFYAFITAPNDLRTRLLPHDVAAGVYRWRC